MDNFLEEDWKKASKKTSNVMPFPFGVLIYLRLLGKLVSKPFQCLIERENSIKIFQFIALFRLFCTNSKKNSENRFLERVYSLGYIRKKNRAAYAIVILSTRFVWNVFMPLNSLVILLNKPFWKMFALTLKYTPFIRKNAPQPHSHPHITCITFT